MGIFFPLTVKQQLKHCLWSLLPMHIYPSNFEKHFLITDVLRLLQLYFGNNFRVAACLLLDKLIL